MEKIYKISFASEMGGHGSGMVDEYGCYIDENDKKIFSSMLLCEHEYYVDYYEMNNELLDLTKKLGIQLLDYPQRIGVRYCYIKEVEISNLYGNMLNGKH